MGNYQYYIIKPKVDTKEIGNVFPSASIIDDYNFKAPNSVHNLKRFEFPCFRPDLRFKLNKGAKLTDVISQIAINGNGLLVSSRFSRTLSQYNLSSVGIYEASVCDKNNKHEKYYWYHFINDFSVVSWDLTSFGLKADGSYQKIKIKNKDEYLSIRNKVGAFGLKFIDIKLIPNKKDVFSHPFYGYLLASERLKNDIENNSDLTGICFELIPPIC